MANEVMCKSQWRMRRSLEYTGRKYFLGLINSLLSFLSRERMIKSLY